MSYGPPAGGLPAAPTRDRAAALPGLAVIMIMSLILELALLGYDLNQKGPVYLADALGITYSHTVLDAPVGFIGADSATCVALLVMIIAAFTGRGWIRAAGAVLLLVNAYNSFQILVTQLANTDARHGFAAPFSHLALNLDEVAQIALALVFALVVAATGRPKAVPTPATPVGFPTYQPGYAPPPPPQQPPATFGYPPAPTDAPRAS